VDFSLIYIYISHNLGILSNLFTIIKGCMDYNGNIITLGLQRQCDSLAEWSKAPDLGSGPKGRGFKSHSCQLSLLSCKPF
jgi:hypothetical protein